MGRPRGPRQVDTRDEGPVAERSDLLGRVLTRVTYFNLADAYWDRTPEIHRLDFGLDLEFGDVVVGVTWGVPGHNLDIRLRSLAAELLDPVTMDATSLAPWRDVIGQGVSDVIEGAPNFEWGDGGQPCRWYGAIEFRGTNTIWFAAVNFEPDDYLLPCGDELIVTGDAEIAARLGLAERIGPKAS